MTISFAFILKYHNPLFLFIHTKLFHCILNYYQKYSSSPITDLKEANITQKKYLNQLKRHSFFYCYIKRAVAGQHSSPESRLANKIKKHLTKKINMNSNSLVYEDLLYFDLQPHSMACTLGSVIMEWKQTPSEI